LGDNKETSNNNLWLRQTVPPYTRYIQHTTVYHAGQQ